MVDLRTLSTAGVGLTDPILAQFAASAVCLDSVVEFVNFWHAAYNSPAVSTFLTAIDKSFISVSGLTSEKVRRHPPDSLVTTYGHLHTTRKGIRSTTKNLLPMVLTSTAKSDDNVDPASTLSKNSGAVHISMLLEPCRREGALEHYINLFLPRRLQRHTYRNFQESQWVRSACCTATSFQVLH
jgi:hypothetical protein